MRLNIGPLIQLIYICQNTLRTGILFFGEIGEMNFAILLKKMVFGICIYYTVLTIGIIVILLIVGTTFGDYRSSVVVLDQKQVAIHFVENAAEQLGTDKSHIYINTETSVDGAIIKVDDHFYRVIKGSGDKYLFEKLDLYQPDVELVEAK